MNSVKLILLGIALILFGGVSAFINSMYDIGEVVEIISVFTPFLGIILSIIGATQKDR